MQHRLHVVLAQSVSHELAIAHVADDKLGAFRNSLPIAAQHRVEHDDVMAGLDQALGCGAADETRAAGDKDSHFFTFLSCSSAR